MMPNDIIVSSFFLLLFFFFGGGGGWMGGGEDTKQFRLFWHKVSFDKVLIKYSEKSCTI